MRWFTFDVDFEMYGKDLIESAIIFWKSLQSFGQNSSKWFFAYELFLDEKAKKYLNLKEMESQLTNGLGMHRQKVCHFTCIKIKKSKKLYPEVVPKAVDEYLSSIEKYQIQKTNEKNFKSCMAYS